MLAGMSTETPHYTIVPVADRPNLLDAAAKDRP